jgi:hypothetical protein
MSYTVIGDKTVQMYVDMLGVNSIFSILSDAQKIQYINFGQQECANISKNNNLSPYLASEDMNSATPMLITSGTQIKIGSVGYVVKFDLSTYDMNSIIGVQAKKTSGVWSLPITTPNVFGELAGYIDNALASDVAYNWMKDTLFIFVKSAYTFVTTTLTTFWGYRNAINVTALIGSVDIPGDMEQLALALILRKVCQDQNISLPQNVGQQIRTQCTNLKINYPV